MEEDIKKDITENPSENLGQAQKDLEDCNQKCDEYLNNWKRERADFINYKNDEIKRIGMLAQYTKEETLLKILPVLDSIYLAEKQMPEELGNHNWVVGFLQTKKQIDAFLQKEGIEKIEAIDKPFDPNIMEAIDEVSGIEYKVSGIVIEEVQRGYMMDDKVLRPARVKISK